MQTFALVVLATLSCGLAAVILWLLKRKGQQVADGPMASDLKIKTDAAEAVADPPSVVDVVDEHGTADVQVRVASDADLWGTVPVPPLVMGSARAQAALAGLRPILGRMAKGDSGRFVVRFSPRVTGMIVGSPIWPR
jgi:hypothetical protein